MDSLHFSPPSTHAIIHDDAPRTPSPPAPMQRYQENYKPAALDPVRIFSGDEDHYNQWGQPQYAPPPSAARPSLLQELYEHDSPEHPASPPDMYGADSNESNWPPQQAQQPRAAPPQDYTLIRRATFPYVRQERPEDMPPAAYPPFLYNDNPHHGMPLSAEPSALHGGPEYEFDNGQVKVEDHHPHMGYHPHPHAQQFYARPHPGHLPPHMGGHPGMHPSHLPPHMHPGMHPHHAGGYALNPHGVPVQHTDDAASKETQYLRRRCFNCHTTEPPSWRRSTLNPGKIVCNKCGLYERTHLRARPLRFDELRAGNKARKGGKGVGSSPKQGPAAGGVKKAPGAIARRSSVSSTGSSAQSGSGASDWDDSVSVYSNSHSSAASAYSQSPVPPSLSLSSSSSHNNSPGRDSLSRSPPLLHPQGHPGSPPHSAGSYNGQFAHHSPHLGGSPQQAYHSPSMNGGGNGIRLPHAPDIPTLGRGTKPRSNTTGGLGHHHSGSAYYNGNGHGLHHSSSNSSLHSQHAQGGSPGLAPNVLEGAELYRRGSLPDFHAQMGGVGAGGGWGDEGGMGISVKEEPRALVV
ncbi:hypothetical protein B0H14DRAFT_2684941 [Mycena olivaceomarginata]|nr:hypothetical protein B0H14DRAFT_2684941 [Mycena olivaceomarginata]